MKRSRFAFRVAFLIVVLTAFLSAKKLPDAKEFKILQGSGLINTGEAGVLEADDPSSYEFANLVGRAWMRVLGKRSENIPGKLLIDVPSVVRRLPEETGSDLSFETLQSLMQLTYRYQNELQDLGYGFYLGDFAVYQERDHLTLYGLWDTDRETEQVLTELVKPFVASYSEAINDWARFKLDYVPLKGLGKRLHGELRVGDVSLGGALTANQNEDYTFEAAFKVGQVEVGAGFGSRGDLPLGSTFDNLSSFPGYKLGELRLGTYFNDPVLSGVTPEGINKFDPTGDLGGFKPQIDGLQVTSLVVGIPINQKAILKAGLLYRDSDDEAKGAKLTKGATAGLKIAIYQGSIEADYQYYNEENVTEKNTARFRLGYGITDSTYINLAYRLVTSSEKFSGKTADENLATAEISIQF